MNKEANFPKELDKFNWGAFLLNWIWGLGNGVPKALLALIPIFNIYWIFKLGFNANRWAWEAGNIKDVEAYQKNQRYWLFGALGLYLMMPLLVVGIISTTMSNIAIVDETFQHIKNDAAVVEIAGSPVMKSKLVTGRYHSNQDGFVCSLNYWIYGPDNEGKVLVEAFSQNGQTYFVNLQVYFEATDQVVNFVDPAESEQYMETFRALLQQYQTKG